MNILQILPELNIGGVETGTVDFAKFLVENGHKSVVISNGGSLVPVLESRGSTHYALPVHKKNLFSMIKLVKEVRAIIEKEQIDIVHARSRVPAWISYFACKGTKASFVTTCHGYYQSKLFSSVMGFGKLVIVPSKAIGRHMVEDFGVAAQAIRHIPRSVDISKFTFRTNTHHESGAPRTVAIVGRVTPLKGHTYFLQAMAQVVRSMPFVRVWIIGDVPPDKMDYKKELEDLVDRLQLKKYVEFLGNRSDVPELLKQVDVVVLSTVTQEAFGRVILEAQAAGVPVVATKVGGVVDIIDDEKTGLLVMPKDTTSMARQVLRLLRDPALGQQLSKAALEKIRQQYLLEHQANKTLAVYDELLKSTNILVIKLSAAGDVILATPSLRAVRKAFPRAKIYCLTHKNYYQILQSCPYLNGVIVYDPNDKEKGLAGLLQMVKRLRFYNFDIVIDLQNNWRTHLLTFLCMPGKSYGYDNGKLGWLLTNRIRLPQEKMGPVAHQFKVLNMLGIENTGDDHLEMWTPRREESYVDEIFEEEWLANSKRIVGINLAASLKWETKNWPIESIAKLCDMMAKKNIRVVITGMDKDRELGRSLMALTSSKPALLIGKTDLSQLAYVIKRCHVFITPDSAPMHIAAAVGTPLIAFFGPTDPERHLPPGEKIFVFRKLLTCSPCYGSRCRIATHDCMRTISPEEVMEKVEELIKDS